MWNSEVALFTILIVTLPTAVIVVARRAFRASPSGAIACSVFASVVVWGVCGLIMGMAMVYSWSPYEIRKFGWRLEVIPITTFVAAVLGLAYSLPAVFAYGLTIFTSLVVRWLVIERRDKYYVRR